jgi:hypothetical protein
VIGEGRDTLVLVTQQRRSAYSRVVFGKVEPVPSEVRTLRGG